MCYKSIIPKPAVIAESIKGASMLHHKETQAANIIFSALQTHMGPTMIHLRKTP